MVVIFIIYDLGIVCCIVDWVYVMKVGEVVEYGQIVQIFVQLDYVYMKMLLDVELMGYKFFVFVGILIFMEVQKVVVEFVLEIGLFVLKYIFWVVDDVSFLLC